MLIATNPSAAATPLYLTTDETCVGYTQTDDRSRATLFARADRAQAAIDAFGRRYGLPTGRWRVASDVSAELRVAGAVRRA